MCHRSGVSIADSADASALTTGEASTRAQLLTSEWSTAFDARRDPPAAADLRGRFPRVGERPLALFADYALNTEADDYDSGFALGATLGEVTGPRTWRIGYAYQDLEADAVIGTFTDSDWSGGGTDGTGHVVEFNYGFRDRLVFGFRYFLNERGANAGNERDYNRLQADVQFNY